MHIGFMALEMQAYWVYGLGHGIIGAYGQWTGRHHGFIDIGQADIMALWTLDMQTSWVYRHWTVQTSWVYRHLTCRHHGFIDFGHADIMGL